MSKRLPLVFRLWVFLLVALVVGSWTYFVFGGAPSAVQAEPAARQVAQDPVLPEPLLVPGEGKEPGLVRRQPSELPAPKGLDLDLDSYPKTNGSTSAMPLGVWVAARTLGIDCKWQPRAFSQSWLWFDLPEKAPQPTKGKKIQLTGPKGKKARLQDREATARKLRLLYHRGTHQAYVNLINGATDLIYECRLPSEDEKKMLAEKGVKLDIRPIAYDAFVFLVHKDNPVEGLTLEQIRGVYAPAEGSDKHGSITNWKAVGGPDAAINAYIRNRNSGSQETMESLVLDGKATIQGARGMTGVTMMGPYNRLHDDPNGLGYTFFYYQKYMAPLRSGRLGRLKPDDKKQQAIEPLVKMLAVDGVAPSRETIADGSYPLVTKVYAVTRQGIADDTPAAKLRDWLGSAEGQAVVGETGYVPLTARREDRGE